MGRVMARIFEKYGQPMTLRHGDRQVELRVFLRPAEEWGTGNVPGAMGIPQTYLCYGAAEPEMEQGDELYDGRRRLVIRETQVVWGIGGEAYRRSVCAEKGGTAQWKSNGSENSGKC